MATSGTVGNTEITVSTMIEHSLRRAGIPASEVTPDIVRSAKNNLYFYLSSLSNAGVNLWTIEKDIKGLTKGQNKYALTKGDLDVKNILRRQINYPSGGTAASSAGGTAANAFDKDFSTACTQNAADGNISYDFSSATNIELVGFMPNNDSYYAPVFEFSSDGISWTTFLSIDQQKFSADVWYFYDLSIFQSYRHFRMRETSGGILDIVELCFGSISIELPMSRMSLDQYSNLTNKNLDSNFVQQYWVDRKVDAPVINVWPTPDSNLDQMVIYKTRQIQDVGSLTNTLELPQRWIEAGIDNLAVRMLLELPKVDTSRYDILKKQAESSTFAAQQEERDKSPIFFSPEISCYTR